MEKEIYLNIATGNNVRSVSETFIMFSWLPPCYEVCSVKKLLRICIELILLNFSNLSLQAMVTCPHVNKFKLTSCNQVAVSVK